MNWPNHIDSKDPRLTASGAWSVTESYWRIGIIKLAPATIFLATVWATDESRDNFGPVVFWVAAPFLILGFFGIFDCFRRRRYDFYPIEKKVAIEGFSLAYGRFKKSFAYEDLRTSVLSRWVYSGILEKRYFAMFHFPKTDVAFFSSTEKAETQSALVKLEQQLGLSPAN